jgi:transposase
VPGGGRPRNYPLRLVTDALLYVLKTSCKWRQMPANFPPWKTDYQQLRSWGSEQGMGARGQDVARAGPQGAGLKRHAQHGDHRFPIRQDGAKRGRRGYDAGKKIKRRKRHIAVDPQGNLLAVIVHSAGFQDRVAARAAIMRSFCLFGIIQAVFVDGGYTGTLIEWASQMFGYTA